MFRSALALALALGLGCSASAPTREGSARARPRRPPRAATHTSAPPSPGPPSNPPPEATAPAPPRTAPAVTSVVAHARTVTPPQDPTRADPRRCVDHPFTFASPEQGASLASWHEAFLSRLCGAEEDLSHCVREPHGEDPSCLCLVLCSLSLPALPAGHGQVTLRHAHADAQRMSFSVSPQGSVEACEVFAHGVVEQIRCEVRPGE